MPRTPRSKLTPGWYHCINRGVNKNDIYLDIQDYSYFQNLLHNTFSEFKLDLGCYCLMPNHWHIVLRCEEVNDMSKFFKKLLNLHTKYFHTRHQKIGHGPIYQGRYKSYPVKDEQGLERLFDYVALNPVRAGLVDSPEKWRWSRVGTLGGLSP